jgi:hypothetical protein
VFYAELRQLFAVTSLVGNFREFYFACCSWFSHQQQATNSKTRNQNQKKGVLIADWV